MDSRSAGSARRELALVLALAACGIAVVLLVALAPWYDPVGSGVGGADVVQTYPPVDLKSAIARLG
jgi:hypothetical protein